ncbi:MAG: hypothetical protein IKQ75_05040 [Bacteroidales bacterium]|nr:hypothetical protein [Bacteroidales bacterium]MBR6161215.1 hypothetical protein [Bacteroidales bacterium]
MRKFCSLFFLILTTLSSLFAQEPLDELLDGGLSGVPLHSHFASIDNNHYVIFSSAYLNQDVLVTLPENDGKGSQVQQQHPTDYVLLVAYEDANNIHGIYKHYNYKTQTYGLYLNSYQKAAASAEWKPENLISVPLDKSEDIRVRSAVSPDRSKAAVALFLTNFKANSLKGSLVLAFDENGMRWKNPLDLEFENNTIQILDFAVSNNMKAYTSILSFDKDKDGKQRENEVLHLYESGEYGELNNAECAIEFGSLSCGRLLMTRKGGVMMGGYYAPEPEKKETGCYMVHYGMSPLECANISHEDFPETYYAYVHTSAGKKAKDFSVYPMAFYEFADGNVALLGDMYTTYNLTMTFSAGGNIVIHMADSRGDITQFKTVGKMQTSVMVSPPASLNKYLFSYHALMHNDKIHIFFSDNIKNYQGGSGQNSFVDVSMMGKMLYKGHCAAHCTLDHNGEVSKPELLMDYADYGGYMIAPLYVEDDGFVFLKTGKKARQIAKLKHSF